MGNFESEWSKLITDVIKEKWEKENKMETTKDNQRLKLQKEKQKFDIKTQDKKMLDKLLEEHQLLNQQKIAINPVEINEQKFNEQKISINQLEIDNLWINFNIDKNKLKPWVKEKLIESFSDIENPKQDEIIKVLELFKGIKFDKNCNIPKWSAKAIFAIQAWLRILWKNITVDWIYWLDTKRIIKEFQEEYIFNKNWKKKKGDWIPGIKTITSLISALVIPEVNSQVLCEQIPKIQKTKKIKAKEEEKETQIEEKNTNKIDNAIKLFWKWYDIKTQGDYEIFKKILTEAWVINVPSWDILLFLLKETWNTLKKPLFLAFNWKKIIIYFSENMKLDFSWNWDKDYLKKYWDILNWVFILSWWKEIYTEKFADRANTNLWEKVFENWSKYSWKFKLSNNWDFVLDWEWIMIWTDWSHFKWIFKNNIIASWEYKLLANTQNPVIFNVINWQIDRDITLHNTKYEMWSNIKVFSDIHWIPYIQQPSKEEKRQLLLKKILTNANNDLLKNWYNIKSKFDYEAYWKTIVHTWVKLPTWKSLLSKINEENSWKLSKPLSLCFDWMKVSVFYWDIIYNDFWNWEHAHVSKIWEIINWEFIKTEDSDIEFDKIENNNYWKFVYSEWTFTWNFNLDNNWLIIKNWKWKYDWNDWSTFLWTWKNNLKEWKWTMKWFNWSVFLWIWKNNKREDWEYNIVIKDWNIINFKIVDWKLDRDIVIENKKYEKNKKVNIITDENWWLKIEEAN